MSEAQRDNNSIPTLLATSNVDGSTPSLVKVHPTAHSIDIEDGTSGSDLSNDIASRDNNGVVVMMGVSSTDGVTPVAIYMNPTTGKLLTKST